MKSCTYLFTRGWVVGSVWKGSLVLSALCSFFIRHVVGCVAVPSSSCPVLAEFPFYFQVTSTCLNIAAALYTPLQCFTFFIASGLIARFLLLLKCSFQFHFSCSSARFHTVFSPVAFQMHDFWKLSELAPRVHQLFTSGPSWSNCHCLAAPMWEHSATTTWPCGTPASGPHLV